MKFSSKWYVLYEGQGSACGNGWIEEVCYLGHKQWLSSLRDDPAWSIGELVVQEPEESASTPLLARAAARLAITKRG